MASSGAGASIMHARYTDAELLTLFPHTKGYGGKGKRGRKGRRGRAGSRRGSPLPYEATRDPWGHKDMLRSSKNSAARSSSR